MALTPDEITGIMRTAMEKASKIYFKTCIGEYSGQFPTNQTCITNMAIAMFPEMVRHKKEETQEAKERLEGMRDQ